MICLLLLQWELLVNWLIWDSVLVLEVLFHQTQSDLVSLVP
ncbi:Uncharacterised protein [Mycobacterium tuberculosis]|nr:Uncharacterised protein [Mycobacterium tuberculosis]